MLGAGQSLLDGARRAGADQADVCLMWTKEFELTVRQGSIEVLKQSVARGAGLRVIHDRRLGFSHTNDLSAESLRRVVEQTMAMARHATRDEHLGLPEFTDPASGGTGDLQLEDPALAALTTERKIEMAQAMEQAALQTDPRVLLVEGASFADETTDVVLLNSRGFWGHARGTASSLSCAVVAQQDGKKQIGHWYSHRRFLLDHETPEHVGATAAERAVRLLGARSVPTGRYPVILDPLMAASLLGAVASALNGESVYRKLSFLTERLGREVGSPVLTVYDDGVMPRGLGSRPFDGEGVPTRRKVVIENGILRTFLYDSYTGRKAGVPSTGNAVRGYDTLPHIGPLNFYLQAGPYPPGEILRSVQQGLYVTSMIGFGVDTVSGQFSRGASGLWIDNGAPAFPVHEVTIAGNLLDMLAAIDMVGSDLELRGQIASPTVRIREMTVSGD